jgi:hypothetical protein
MEETCVVCYEPDELDNLIKCGNPDCTTYMCQSCGDRFVEISKNEATVPACPNSNCGVHYPSSQFRNARTRALQQELVFDYLTMRVRDALSVSANQKAMLERIRKERNEFIRGNFSTAVNLVINIALESKRRRIGKANQLKILRHVENRHRCQNFMCNGYLDSDFVCAVCESSFCKECHKRAERGTPHECKKEDVDSVRFVSELVKCPECHSPVLRSWGCNAITCSICRINFDYVTGRRCKAGNHTMDPKLILRQQTASVSEMFPDSPHTRLLERIDALRPAEYPFENIQRAIKNNESKNKVAIKYSKYLSWKMRSKVFFACIDELGKMGEFPTEAGLEAIVKKLNGLT